MGKEEGNQYQVNRIEWLLRTGKVFQLPVQQTDMQHTAAYEWKTKRYRLAANLEMHFDGISEPFNYAEHHEAGILITSEARIPVDPRLSVATGLYQRLRIFFTGTKAVSLANRTLLFLTFPGSMSSPSPTVVAPLHLVETLKGTLCTGRFSLPEVGALSFPIIMPPDHRLLKAMRYSLRPGTLIYDENDTVAGIDASTDGITL